MLLKDRLDIVIPTFNRVDSLKTLLNCLLILCLIMSTGYPDLLTLIWNILNVFTIIMLTGLILFYCCL